MDFLKKFSDLLLSYEIVCYNIQYNSGTLIVFSIHSSLL